MRAIATDLDGTLLTPAGTIHPVDAEALHAAHSLGVAIVVATGRPSRWLDVLAPLQRLDPIVIASNGAVIIRGGEPTDHAWLDVETVSSLLTDLSDALPGALFALERGDLFGCEPLAWSRFEAEPGTLRAPAHELLDIMGPPLKLLVFHDSLDSDRLHAEAEVAIAGRATATHSLTHNKFGLIELSAPGVTKAQALRRVAAELGVDAADFVVFGDMPNDEEMLEWAGRGFVMGNAHPDLLARFEVVASNADAGVGRTLNRLLGRPV